MEKIWAEHKTTPSETLPKIDQKNEIKHVGLQPFVISHQLPHH